MADAGGQRPHRPASKEKNPSVLQRIFKKKPPKREIPRPLSEPEHSGWLYVAGHSGMVTTWDKRWVELHGGFVQKCYIFNHPDEAPMAEYEITGCSVRNHPTEPFAFTVYGGKLPHDLNLSGDGDRRKDLWWKEFMSAIKGQSLGEAPAVAPPPENPSLADFDLLKVIGKGAFGQVMRVRRKDTGEIFALKSMVKRHVVEKDMVERTLAEATLLKELSHPFVMRLHYTFQTPDRLFLVFTYLPGGNLWYYFYSEGGSFKEPVVRFYAAQLVAALDYVHGHRIVHRDIKPDNLLLDGRGNLILSDFGMATKIPEGQMLRGYVGVVAFAAPELVKKEDYDMMVDIWSTGVVVYKMLCGGQPFAVPDKDDKEGLMEVIATKEPDYPAQLSPLAVELLKAFLTKDRTSRPTAKALRSHAFFEAINWDKLERCRLPAPFCPDGKGFDTQYVNQKYLNMPTELTFEEALTDIKFEGFAEDLTSGIAVWHGNPTDLRALVEDTEGKAPDWVSSPSFCRNDTTAGATQSEAGNGGGDPQGQLTKPRPKKKFECRALNIQRASGPRSPYHGGAE